MECSVCGQPGATKCLAVDQFDNPVGEWVHTHCAPRSYIGREYQSFRGVSYHRFPAEAQSALQKMRPKTGQIRIHLGSGLQHRPYRWRKV